MSIIHNQDFKDMMEYDILGGFSRMKERPFTEEEIEKRLRKIYNMDDTKFLLIDDSMRKRTDTWRIIEDPIALKTKKFEDEKILSFDDKNLLIEYAPRLFDTWDNINTLKQTMFDLVDKVYHYKFSVSPTNIHNKLNDELSTKYSNDNSKKIESLSTHLKEALDLMSRKLDMFGGRVGTTIEDNFTDKLPKSLATKHEETVGNLVVGVISKIIQNPEKYIMKKIPIPATEKKNDLKEYLINLKLKGKSDEINCFIQALK